MSRAQADVGFASHPASAAGDVGHGDTKVSTMRMRIDDEIAAMKVRELPPVHAHHLIIEAVRRTVLPASRLPKVIEAWNEPRHEEFWPRTAWSLFNAFSEVRKGSGPRCKWKVASGSAHFSERSAH